MTAVTRSGLAPVVQESAPLRRKIAASIRRAVEMGTFPPGTRLVEKDLCQDLNVSRTSLREALRELEAEGLLVTGVRGVMVAQITEHEARNIYRVRAALEGLVAEQFAADASAQHRAELDAIVKALADAYDCNDFPAIVSEKDRFYEVLCIGANNQIVLDVLVRLNARINRLRSLSRSDPARGVASLREIKAIAAAIRARDPERAKAAAARHVEEAARAALKLRDAFLIRDEASSA